MCHPQWIKQAHSHLESHSSQMTRTLPVGTQVGSKHFDDRLNEGTLHAGWVDAKTGDPVNDKDVRGKYEKAILSHTDIWILGELILVPALSYLMPSIRA